MLFDEYEAVCREHQALYGSSAVVLFEVGSFYEIYGFHGRGCDVRGLCALLNIQATRKNKNIQELSETNPELAGFPALALPKYLPILVDAGLTVVIVNQHASTDGGGIVRRVSRVVSKGTYVPEEDDARILPVPNLRTCIACIYVNTTAAKDARQPRLSGIGISLMDLKTGRSDVWEAWGDGVTPALDILCTFHIAEAVIYGDVTPEASFIIDQMQAHGLSPKMMHARLGVVHPYANLAYQKRILSVAFPDVGLLSHIEFCGLERQPLATVAFTALLDFAYQHDASLIRNLPKPCMREVDPSDCVKLSPKTFVHLNVIPCKSQSTSTPDASLCLAHLLNVCVTPMGKRLMQERLSQPVAAVSTLTARYDATEGMWTCYADVRKCLKPVGSRDVERIWRRWCMQSGSLRDAPFMRLTLAALEGLLLDCVVPAAVYQAMGIDAAELQDCVEVVRRSLAAVDEEGKIRAGTFLDLDAARQQVDMHEQTKAAWISTLVRAVSSSSTNNATNDSWVRPGNNDDLCPHAICTPKRFQLLVRALGSSMTLHVLEQSKTQVKFTSTEFIAEVGTHQAAKANMEHITLQRTQELQQCITQQAATPMEKVFAGIALLDLHAAMAKEARARAWVRPQLDACADAAYIECRGLRHPIVERACQDVPFIDNDVALGGQHGDGLLLFGINAAGKSTLSKALALAVLMAQTGFFCACSAVTLAPFRRVLTHMHNQDDIYRAKSLFMVELAALRDILTVADERTLVIGDELCSGTESASAVSLVGAACKNLVRSRSKFIFATHLHELSHMTLSDRLRIEHLSVHYDEQLDALVYDRKLQPGPGTALYGLEVARALHMDATFMADAYQLRRELLGLQEHVVDPQRRSNYNASLFMGMCSVCNKVPAVETHHRVPQALADKTTQLIGVFHKNSMHNLVPLCSTCHDDVHAGRVIVQAPVTSTRGTLRRISRHATAHLANPP